MNHGIITNTGLACIVGLMTLAPVAGAGDLTTHQVWALEYAAVVGTSYYSEPLPAGYQYERTLEAVLITESSLCRHKRGIDHRGYGCGQLHRGTAHKVNGSAVSVGALKHNDALNIRLAGRYLSYCMQQMSSWIRGVVCYNKGPHRARAMSDSQIAADTYLKTIRRHIREADRLTASLN
jgi:hypothetical protein